MPSALPAAKKTQNRMQPRKSRLNPQVKVRVCCGVRMNAVDERSLSERSSNFCDQSNTREGDTFRCGRFFFFNLLLLNLPRPLTSKKLKKTQAQLASLEVEAEELQRLHVHIASQIRHLQVRVERDEVGKRDSFLSFFFLRHRLVSSLFSLTPHTQQQNTKSRQTVRGEHLEADPGQGQG